MKVKVTIDSETTSGLAASTSQGFIDRHQDDCSPEGLGVAIMQAVVRHVGDRVRALQVLASAAAEYDAAFGHAGLPAEATSEAIDFLDGALATRSKITEHWVRVSPAAGEPAE